MEDAENLLLIPVNIPSAQKIGVNGMLTYIYLSGHCITRILHNWVNR